MGKAVRMQFFVMVNKKEFKLAFSFTFCWALYCYWYEVKQQTGTDLMVYWDATQFYCGSNLHPLWYYFTFLFPILVVLPYATSYIVERANGTSILLISKMGVQRYILSKVIVCFIGGFLIIMLPFLINYILCQVTFPHTNNIMGAYYGTEGYDGMLTGTYYAIHVQNIQLPFLKLYLNYPHLYYIWYIVLLSTLSGVFGVILLCFSFLIRRGRIFLFIPLFVLLKLMNVLTEYSYKNAGSNPFSPLEVESMGYKEGPEYVCYNLLEYVNPFGERGQNTIYLFCVAVIIVTFCSICIKFAIKKEMRHIQGE